MTKKWTQANGEGLFTQACLPKPHKSSQFTSLQSHTWVEWYNCHQQGDKQDASTAQIADSLWTSLKPFISRDTFWVCTKSNDIMLYSSTGNSRSVWERSYPSATLLLSQPHRSSPPSTFTLLGKLAPELHLFFLLLHWHLCQ